MQYMNLDAGARDELLTALAGMADLLQASFGKLSPAQARMRGKDGAFAPVEQVWHLADLEREGFGVRIRRLQSEIRPFLPDFDGDRVAMERNYKTRSLREGMRAFAEARTANLAMFATLSSSAWSRTGTQEGVGEVALCDMPELMRQHDRAHIAEIEAWMRQRGGTNPAPARG